MVVLYLREDEHERLFDLVRNDAELADRISLCQVGRCSKCGSTVLTNKPKYAVCYDCLYRRQKVNVVYLT